MNYGIAVLTFLFLSSLAATVFAASSVNVNSQTSVNASQNTTTANSQVTSSNNARVENHITVEVNGEKRVIDDVKEGSSVNSNLKVEAKSANGQTTFNIEGNPQSVKSESTISANSQSKPAKLETTTDKDIETKETSFFAKIVTFFKGIFSLFKLFS